MDVTPTDLITHTKIAQNEQNPTTDTRVSLNLHIYMCVCWSRLFHQSQFVRYNNIQTVSSLAHIWQLYLGGGSLAIIFYGYLLRKYIQYSMLLCLGAKPKTD